MIGVSLILRPESAVERSRRPYLQSEEIILGKAQLITRRCGRVDSIAKGGILGTFFGIPPKMLSSNSNSRAFAIVIVESVEMFDQYFKVDDPVGAVSVHGVCGALGTLLVGVFAIDGGLINGGGWSLLGVQAIGVISIGLWAFIMGFILFSILKATGNLRVSKRIEEEGLDVYEHGESVYN